MLLKSTRHPAGQLRYLSSCAIEENRDEIFFAQPLVDLVPGHARRGRIGVQSGHGDEDAARESCGEFRRKLRA